MKVIQVLIDRKVKDEKKSLRQIAHESGVEYTSVNNYYHSNVEPRGKNAKLLGEYFRIPFHVLFDEYTPDHQRLMLSDKQRELAEIAPDVTDDEAQLLLDLFRNVRSRQKPVLLFGTGESDT
jgi:transcriptional regulator with XRE-family HTH domain